MEAQLAASNNHDEIIVDYDEIWVKGSERTDASRPQLDLNSEEKQVLLSKGMVRVEEDSTEYQLIKKSFLKGLEYMGQVTVLMAVHKNNVSWNLERQIRSDSFRIFSQAVANHCGGNANVRYAWYGGSLNELLEIVSSGFCICSNSITDDSYGVGIQLFPPKFSVDGAMSTVANADGSRHMLLCRVILGRVEVVPEGSKQRQPSSVHYNSGVDNISDPRKYIIWTSFMNLHIHPDYIISFKFTFPEDGRFKQNPSFPLLMAKLSEHLGPSKMASLAKGYRRYQEKRITKGEWSMELRKIIGERLVGFDF